jgi:site-specific recombinase XerD
MAISVLDNAPRSPLRNLVDDYLMHGEARGLAPKTLHGYGYSLEQIFLPWCTEEGIADVAELDRRAVDRFTSTLLKRSHPDGREISRHTVSSYIRPVRLLLNWASREGEDVRAKPQLPRCEQMPRDVLNREEMDRLEKAKPTERDKLIIRIFGDCGLRLDELTKLTSRDIVRSGRQGFLRVLGKRNRVRDVPVPPQLLRRIERHIANRPDERQSDQIFLTLRRGPDGAYGPLTPHGVEEAITDAGARAALGKRVYPHLLRHSWMTEMVRTGMHPFQLSVIAGASPQVIARYYTHLTKSDAYEAMLRSLGVGNQERQERHRYY